MGEAKAAPIEEKANKIIILNTQVEENVMI